MRIRVAAEQQHEEYSMHVVDTAWRAAEPWQHELADQRLDLKEQEGAEEDCEGECSTARDAAYHRGALAHGANRGDAAHREANRLL